MNEAQGVKRGGVNQALITAVRASEDWTKDLAAKHPALPQAVSVHLMGVAMLLNEVLAELRGDAVSEFSPAPVTRHEDSAALDVVPLEELLERYGLGVAPVWQDGRRQWAAYEARRNEPTDCSYADSPRAACYGAIAALSPVTH